MVWPFNRLLLSFFALSGVLLFTNSVEAACGEIAVSKGDVQFQSGQTKKTAPAAKGTKVCQGDTIIAGTASRAKIVMDDGNELNISPESRILLEEYTYKPADNKKKVMLNVIYGKVRTATKTENMYGDKAADGQANSFRVKTKSAVAGVRGTDFLTSYDRSSRQSAVITFRGRVEVGTLGANGKILNSVLVGVGQKTIIQAGKVPAAPKRVPQTEFQKENKESHTDTGSLKSGTPANGTQAEPASSTGGDKSDSASTTKDSSPEKSERAPASDTASRGPASMIDASDLGQAPDQSPALPSSPVNGPGTILPPIVNRLPIGAPVCELCNRAIENGPSKVKVIINLPTTTK